MLLVCSHNVLGGGCYMPERSVDIVDMGTAPIQSMNPSPKCRSISNASVPLDADALADDARDCQDFSHYQVDGKHAKDLLQVSTSVVRILSVTLSRNDLTACMACRPVQPQETGKTAN